MGTAMKHTGVEIENAASFRGELTRRERVPDVEAVSMPATSTWKIEARRR